MSFWEKIVSGVDAFWEQFVNNTGLTIVRTLAFLVLGLVIIRIVQIIARSASLKSRRLDRAASTFVLSILTVVLYIALVIVLVSSLGFSTAGIIAAFSAVALAVALALKDSLGSLANGVIIIFTKPFKKGDSVKIGDYMGSVQEIRLFNTKILTPDNDTVIIPNSDVLGSELVNYSTMPMRRIAFNFSVAYGEDPETVKRVVLEGVKAIPNVVETPAPSVVITDYQASAVGYSVRVWTPNEFYWTTHAAIRDTVLKVLNENGLEIPYDRLEVTMRPNASYGGDEK